MDFLAIVGVGGVVLFGMGYFLGNLDKLEREM